MFTIYKLIDQKTEIPFYVGFSKNKKNRFKQHVYYATLNKHTNVLKDEKLISLLNEGFNYNDICITETKTITEEEAKKIEIDIIKHYGRFLKNEGPLLNMTDGGDGYSLYGTENGMYGKPSPFKGKNHTTKTKHILSEYQKQSWINTTFNERFGDKAQKIRNASLKARTGSHHSDESKQKISNTLKGRKLTDEHKQKILNSSFKNPPNKKLYKLISPNGTEYITTNGLASFCREHNLHLSAFKVLLFKGLNKPIRENSKIYGWCIFPIDTYKKPQKL